MPRTHYAPPPDPIPTTDPGDVPFQAPPPALTTQSEPEEYRRMALSGRRLRCQVIPLAGGGWGLTHEEEVGRGPADLRGYAGGWVTDRRVMRTRDEALARLRRLGYAV